MLFLVTGRVAGAPDPTPELLRASKNTLELLGDMQRQGKVRGGGVFVGARGVCFIVDADDNEDLHLTLTTLPSFRFAEWEATPLIPFHRDIEMSLDDAIARAKEER